MIGPLTPSEREQWIEAMARAIADWLLESGDSDSDAASAALDALTPLLVEEVRASQEQAWTKGLAAGWIEAQDLARGGYWPSWWGADTPNPYREGAGQ